MNQLEHYGIKGMRWGRRKKRAITEGEFRKREAKIMKKGETLKYLQKILKGYDKINFVARNSLTGTEHKSISSAAVELAIRGSDKSKTKQLEKLYAEYSAQ